LVVEERGTIQKKAPPDYFVQTIRLPETVQRIMVFFDQLILLLRFILFSFRWNSVFIEGRGFEP